MGEAADVTEILEIEQQVEDTIHEIMKSVEDSYRSVQGLDRKHAVEALKVARVPYFSLTMVKYTGKEPDYVGYFESKVLRELFIPAQVNLGGNIIEEDE